MDECLFWLIGKWTILRDYVYTLLKMSWVGLSSNHRVITLITHPYWLFFLPSFLLPSPALLLPRIACQINYLHTISYLRFSFPEGGSRIAKVSSLCNPDKSQGPMRLSLGRMSNAQPSKQQWHHEKEFQSLASIKMHQRESNIF